MANTDCISPNSSKFATAMPVKRRIELAGLDHEATVNAEFFDPAKCTAEDIAELCCNQAENEAAANARLLADPIPPESVIYIIGPANGEACKIGVAMNPAKRLAELQIGCWKELKIFALFWFIEGSVYGAEKLAHRIADRMGKRLQGEWVDMDPGGAAYVVGSVIHSLRRVKVADSAMWLRQRQALMRLRCTAISTAEDNSIPTGFQQTRMDAVHVDSGTVEPAAVVLR